MIAMAARTGDFLSLARYLEHGERRISSPRSTRDPRKDPLKEENASEEASPRVLWHETRETLATTIQGAAREMHQTSLPSRRVKRPAYHVSVSFDPDDPVPRPTAVYVADQVLEALELTGHQAVIVAHGDAPYPHFHLMVNRVDALTRRVQVLPYDHYRLERLMRRMERELGLKATPPHRWLRNREHPVDLNRLPNHLSAQARQALRQAATWDELDLRLRAAGMALYRNDRSFYVTDGVHREITASLARHLSPKRLWQRFGPGYDGIGAKCFRGVLSHEQARRLTMPPAGEPEGVETLAVETLTENLSIGHALEAALPSSLLEAVVVGRTLQTRLRWEAHYTALLERAAEAEAHIAEGGKTHTETLVRLTNSFQAAKRAPVAPTRAELRAEAREVLRRLSPSMRRELARFARRERFSVDVLEALNLRPAHERRPVGRPGPGG